VHVASVSGVTPLIFKTILRAGCELSPISCETFLSKERRGSSELRETHRMDRYLRGMYFAVPIRKEIRRCASDPRRVRSKEV